MSTSRKLFLLLFVFYIGFATNVMGVDLRWRYAGYSALSKVEKTYNFYDSENVEVNPNGTIRVWIKAITAAEVAAVLKKHEKKLIDKATERVIKKQYILFATYQNMDFNTMIELIPYEEIANIPDAHIRLKLFLEINCEKKMVRTLSITEFDKDGIITGKSSGGEGKWDYISPDSNSDILRKMLCP